MYFLPYNTFLWYFLLLQTSSKGNIPLQAYFFLPYLIGNVIKYQSNYTDKEKGTKPFYNIFSITHSPSTLTLTRRSQQIKAGTPFPQYVLCRYAPYSLPNTHSHVGKSISQHAMKFTRTRIFILSLPYLRSHLTPFLFTWFLKSSQLQGLLCFLTSPPFTSVILHYVYYFIIFSY